jgi:hypothetical protein
LRPFLDRVFRCRDAGLTDIDARPQWSNTRKSLILVVCSLYSFLSNSALLGPSVYIGIYAEEFGIDANTASNLVSYANLAFGFGGSTEGESG